MKRSEILYDLAALLQNTEYIDVPMSQYIQDEALALEILDFLEKAGMLPPVCDLFDDGDRHSGWEPENE